MIGEQPRCEACAKAVDDWAKRLCVDCQNAIYAVCPGRGVDDLCSGDPENCGLCTPW